MNKKPIPIISIVAFVAWALFFAPRFENEGIIFTPEFSISAQGDFGLGSCMYDVNTSFSDAVMLLDSSHVALRELNVALAGIAGAATKNIVVSLAAFAALELGRIADYNDALRDLQATRNGGVDDCKARAEEQRNRSIAAQLHAESLDQSDSLDISPVTNRTIPLSYGNRGSVSAERVD